MKAFVFPGQGAQFVGMGKDLYDNNPLAKELFEKANDILGYRITDIMFAGTDDDLKQTKVTQPAVFLHSVISALCMGEAFQPEMVAGHSLGEFSALNSSMPVRWLCRRPVRLSPLRWLPSSHCPSIRSRKSVPKSASRVRAWSFLPTTTAPVSSLSLVISRPSRRLASSSQRLVPSAPWC